MAAAANGQRTRYYTLDSFKLKNGTQLPRLHEYFSQSLLPALDRVHPGPSIFLEAVIAPHVPQVVAIHGFGSLDEMAAVHGKLAGDEGLAKKLDALEHGPEQPFESYDTSLLEAASYSPDIAIPHEAAKAPRIFELRTYHSPSHYQLKALHERFSGAEIRIFHRVGVHPILYSSMIAGQNLPNLTYLIPFDSLAARETAWNAFNADEEWQKVRKDSIDRSGQISSVIQISIFKATAYSPVR